MWFAAAVLGSAQGSVIRGFLQSERADDRLTEELGSADVFVLLLLLSHGLGQLPLLPQFHSWSKENKL